MNIPGLLEQILNLRRINLPSPSIDMSTIIQLDKIYILVLPETNTVINVKCTSKALTFAHLEIEKIWFNGELKEEYAKHNICYLYESFDKIYFTQYNDESERCYIYEL